MNLKKLAYKNFASLLEELDPKKWRTWPLDPKDPKKGTFSVQKASAQERKGGEQKSAVTTDSKGNIRARATSPRRTPEEVVKRTRVTTSAENLGIKGTQTHHTKATSVDTSKTPGDWDTYWKNPASTSAPVTRKRWTSVKGKTNGQRIDVKSFPTRHSSQEESILNVYRNMAHIILK
jgi:hypothetical protein